jgi:hypothetical protein
MHGINEKRIWILVGKPEIGCTEDERMTLKWSTPMGGANKSKFTKHRFCIQDDGKRFT